MAKLHRKCKTGEKWHDDNHLCKISSRGELEKIKLLVIDPKYICKNCGRAAHSGMNLCREMKI